MKINKLWYLITLVALAMLPLVGCSGGGGSGDLSSVKATEKGTQITVGGQVDTAALKTTGKSVALSPYSTVKASTVYVIDAQVGTVLTSGAVDSDGKFSNLTFTLPTSKSILVFKAVAASGALRSIVPIDLSSPPASGVIVASQPIVININATTNSIAQSVSKGLGLTGLLGDGGQTLNSVSKTYTDALTLVQTNGGMTLSYSSGGALALTGNVGTSSSSVLLPARDASTFTFDDMRDITLDGKIISAFIPGDKPVVNLQVVNKATGKGVTGLRTFALHVAQLKPEKDGSASYWQNYIADGLPLTAIPAASAAPVNPSADSVTSFNTDGTVKGQGYSVVDNGDGSYSVTFGASIKANTKVIYDATLVHRIAIGVRSVVVPGVVGKTAGAYAGAINPLTGAVIAQFTNTNGAGLTYDFTPSTGAVYKDATTGSAFARDIITIDACNQCHYKINYGFPLGNNTSGHFGSRPDTKICVVCHTPQLNAIAAFGEGEFTTFIHKIHMGEELPAAETATLTKELDVNEMKFSQDPRNCTVCHKGADVDHWKTMPTRKSCGSCHNNIDFATGANHGMGGAKADDKACATCHDSTSVSGYHLPIDKPNALSSIAVYAGAPYNGVFSTYSAAYQANGRVAPGNPNSNTNASYVAGSSLSRLPVGAKAVTYVISGVSRNASKQPTMTFKFQVATADSKGVLGTPVDVVFNTSTGTNEMMTGFVGSPSAYFVFAVPQDGVAKPVDYNASISGYLKRIWDGTAATVSGATAAATLTGPVSGYYTVTFTGQTVPDNAVMLTGGLGYTYGLGSAMTKVGTKYVPFATTTQPLTQIDMTAYPYTKVAGTPIGIGGLSVPADNKWKVATGYTGRRLITDNAKCNTCHGRLGVKPTYHAGQRNDAQTCTFCHNVNRTNSGWAVNIKEDVHAIHAGAKRTDKFSWEASAGLKYWTVGYPGLLKNCEMCHIAGFYDFSNSAYTGTNATIFDNMLYTTYVSGTIPNPAKVITTGSETIPGTYYSPFVTAGGVYGGTFAYSAATGVTTPAGAATLVASPVSSACYACHDTKAAKNHMIQNGGTVMSPRAAAFTTYSAVTSKSYPNYKASIQVEACVVCHGGISSSNAFNATAPNVKQVHRWW